MDIATMGALATKLTGFTVSFLEGVFCEGFCEVLDLGKDIVFEAIRKGQIDHEAAKALQSVDEKLLDDLKQFVAQELKSKKGKIPTKLKGKQLTEIFTSRLDTVDELVEQYAKERALSEERRLALTYVLGEIKRVAAQAALQTMDGDDKRMVLVLSEVMKNVYSDSIEEISSLLSRTVYIRPTECYNCGNEDLHYDDRMQMASCSHCGRKTAYSKNEGLMNGVQKNLDDFRCMVEQNQQTILAGLAELSKKMDEHDKRNSEEHSEQNKKLDAIQQGVQQVLKNQQSQPVEQPQVQVQKSAVAQPTSPPQIPQQPQSKIQSKAQKNETKLSLFKREQLSSGMYVIKGVKWRIPTHVIIPHNVASIDKKAFMGKRIIEVTLPEGLVRIGANAFANCTSLERINFPNSLKCIEQAAFLNCRNLNIAPPSHVLVDPTAFQGTEYQINQQKVEEARKAEEANIRQFTYKTYTEKGKTYSILTGVIKLNESNVIIPKYDLQGNPVTKIGESAFEECKDLKSVIIPNGVTSIGKYAFCECRNFKSITIPNSVTRIGEYAFRWCSSLTSITIPNSVTIIEKGAFTAVVNLKGVYYTGYRNEWWAIKIGAYNDTLTKATIHYNRKGE